MVKGLYTAYTGMINEQHRMDVLTNNLANASTVGYKKEGATSQGMQNRKLLKSGYGLQLTANKKMGISVLQPSETESCQYPA